MTTETNDEQNTKQESTLMRRLGPLAIGNRGITLQTIDDVFRFAKAVAMSQLCPQGFNETDCFVIIQNGLEVGMSPMAALANTYVVNNRATIFGDMPLALVRQSGLLEDYDQEYIGEEYKDDFLCKVTTLRKGAKKPLITTYSVADAKIAELWGKMSGKDGNKKTPWVTTPKRMLLFRARGFNLRDNFGDVLKGCSIAELNDDFGEEPGFANAKQTAGKVVEPNFDQSPAFATAESQALAGGPLMGEQPIEIPKRGRGRPPKHHEEPQKPTDTPQASLPIATAKEAEKPAESSQGPTVAEPETRAEPVILPPNKPPIATPGTPAKQETDLFGTSTTQNDQIEIRKRLRFGELSEEKFLFLLHDLDLIDCDKSDISAGYFSLANVKPETLKLALRDWTTVMENLDDKQA